jgi:hypothetical protein
VCKKMCTRKKSKKTVKHTHTREKRFRTHHLTCLGYAYFPSVYAQCLCLFSVRLCTTSMLIVRPSMINVYAYCPSVYAQCLCLLSVRLCTLSMLIVCPSMHNVRPSMHNVYAQCPSVYAQCPSVYAQCLCLLSVRLCTLSVRLCTMSVRLCTMSMLIVRPSMHTVRPSMHTALTCVCINEGPLVIRIARQAKVARPESAPQYGAHDAQLVDEPDCVS